MASVDITAALITYLKTLSPITTLVGSSTGARIYPDDLKQAATLPALTVARVGGGPITYLGGRSGFNNATFQVVCYGATRAAADALDNAVFDAIGTAGDVTWGSVKTTECMTVSGSRDSGAILPADGSDARLYWARGSYTVWYFDS